MLFRRKTKARDGVDAGELVFIDKDAPRKTAFRDRIVYAPGDVISVDKVEDVPGYPSSMDGWVQEHETVNNRISDSEGYTAKLKAQHRGKGFFDVIVVVPGNNILGENGKPIGAGQKVNTFKLNRERAEQWAEEGKDPGEVF